MMKGLTRKKLTALLAAACVCLTLPLGAAAAQNNPGAGAQKAAAAASKIADAAALAAVRTQILAVNKTIRETKIAVAQDVAAITRDIAGLKNNPDITAGTEYQTVKNDLEQIKTLVKQANGSNYRSALAAAKGNADAMNAVLATMNQKADTLAQALKLADSAKTAADTLYSQKKAAIDAQQQFQTQAAALKQTIDSGHQQIAAVNDQDTVLLNQIVATFSANKNILTADAEAVAQIDAALTDVKNKLSAEYNGRVAAASQQYETLRKNRDYANAVAQLNTIISLQTERLALLKSVNAELQSALDSLNRLVAGAPASAPAASSGTAA